VSAKQLFTWSVCWWNCKMQKYHVLCSFRFFKVKIYFVCCPCLKSNMLSITNYKNCFVIYFQHVAFLVIRHMFNGIDTCLNIERVLLCYSKINILKQSDPSKTAKLHESCRRGLMESVQEGSWKSATSSTPPTHSIGPIVFNRESSSRVRIVNSERGG
jgi:hypothetical protein